MTTVKNLSKAVTPTKEMLGGNPSKVSSSLKKFMEEECKTVKGRFKNYETPGGNLPFTAGKYPGQPLFSAVFQDGEVYDVPLWVARHLNGIDVTAQHIGGKIGSCSYPIHGFKWDSNKPAPSNMSGPQGEPIPVVGESKRKQRYGFESLDFSAE